MQITMTPMTRLSAWFAAWIDAVLPPRCIACAAPSQLFSLPSSSSTPAMRGMGLAALATARTWCAVCAEQLEPAPAAGSYAYVGPLAAAIVRAKVGRDGAVARALACWWAAQVATTLPPSAAVTFVPAPWRRRVARGFDLPALLAAGIADVDASRPVADLLVAQRHDRKLAQARSREERQVLVQGRFARRRTRAYEELAGRPVLVVDDVHTTGATLAAACAVLGEGGVRPVPWALAVTPAST